MVGRLGFAALVLLVGACSSDNSNRSGSSGGRSATGGDGSGAAAASGGRESSGGGISSAGTSGGGTLAGGAGGDRNVTAGGRATIGGGADAGAISMGGAGASGASGDSGSSNMNGMGGTAGTTSTGGSTGAPCSPAAKFYTFTQLADAISGNCTLGADISSHLPNPSEAAINDLPLPAPMAANVPYSMSMTTTASADTPGGIEIWGSSEECVVDELLWWASVESKTLCAEFTPTRPHTRAVVVIRKLGQLQSVFANTPNDLTLCPNGSCPAGTDGTGLSAGKALPPAPAGVYSLAERDFNTGYDFDVGNGRGRIVALTGTGGANTSPQSLVGGIVRMLPYDPFGDAWYCIGQGSTYTVRDDGTKLMSLRHLTRLPACSGGTGTANATINGALATVMSSFPDLAATGVQATQHCKDNACWFEFLDAAGGKQGFANVTTASAIATTGGTSALMAATWLESSDSSGTMRMTCAGSGSLTYAPSESTQLSLGGMGDFVSCPGAAVTNDSTDIVIE